MSKTKLDIVSLACKRLGVLGSGQELSSADFADAGDLADGFYEEYKASHAPDITWTLDAVPDTHAQAMADGLNEPLASLFGETPSVRQTRAIARLRALDLPDDRSDRRDIDEDGTISDDEAEAGLRAAFY